MKYIVAKCTRYVDDDKKRVRGITKKNPLWVVGVPKDRVEIEMEQLLLDHPSIIKPDYSVCLLRPHDDFEIVPHDQLPKRVRTALVALLVADSSRKDPS